jgi:hypothetical protein
MYLSPGLIPWAFPPGKLVVESRRFAWLPRFLPVIDQHSRWDGKTYHFVWLRWARFVGTDFGWEAVRG